jgi:hypothetical protein
MERQISGEEWPMTFELKYGTTKQRRQSSNFLFLDAPGSTSVVAEEAGDWGTFRMIVARKPQIAFEIKEKERVSQFYQLPSFDEQEIWFPTLRNTIWVLTTRLHDFAKVRMPIAYCYVTLLI